MKQLPPQFSEVLSLIQQARYRALQSVNKELIGLYWQVGEYVSQKVESAEWGQSVVKELADYIQRSEPGITGFSDKNIWRMKQFYEVYSSSPKLSPLVREISWTNNLIILTKAKTTEEKEFYLSLCIKEKYSKRELERQISTCLFERVMLSGERLSPVMRVFPEEIKQAFKDTYILEFIDLPEKYEEKDLKHKIVQNLRRFLLEIGRDFAFMGEEYRLQVGNHDYSIDLLFYNRNLNCLVALELKVVEFQPEFLGKLNFYLEALDRDIRKPHENPSIGILLCRGKDDEVVEYAMSRNMSPALVAEYQLQLPDKKLLRNKLHELFERLTDNSDNEEDISK